MTPTLATIQLVIDTEAAPVPFLMTHVHMTLMDLATKAAKHRKVQGRISDIRAAIFTVRRGGSPLEFDMEYDADEAEGLQLAVLDGYPQLTVAARPAEEPSFTPPSPKRRRDERET